MEKNYLNWPGETHFYIDLENKEYGVRISVKDTYRAKELINRARRNRKKQIEAWKKEWQKEEGVA